MYVLDWNPISLLIKYNISNHWVMKLRHFLSSFLQFQSHKSISKFYSDASEAISLNCIQLRDDLENRLKSKEQNVFQWD